MAILSHHFLNDSNGLSIGEAASLGTTPCSLMNASIVGRVGFACTRRAAQGEPSTKRIQAQIQLGYDLAVFLP